MQTISYWPEWFSNRVFLWDLINSHDWTTSPNWRWTDDHIPLPLIVPEGVLIKVDYLLWKKEDTKDPEYIDYAIVEAEKAKKKKKAKKKAENKPKKKAKKDVKEGSE